MAKDERKIRKSSIIFYFITIIAISICSYISFNNYTNFKKTSEENNKQNKLYKKLKDKYKELSLVNETTNQRLNEYKDLDKTLENTKNKVFELAKQVEEKIKNNETEYKIAYITFDDGPYYLTDSVLNILKEKKVKATFFTIGAGKTSCLDNRSVDCTETYKKIVDNGHTIANHTYSHAIFNGLYSSTSTFINDVSKQEDLIYSKTGVKTNIIRFPGGSSTAKGIKDDIIANLHNKGYGWVDWTAEDGDGKSLSSKEQAMTNLERTINDNIEVILFHDYNRITYSILPEAIDYLEERNYILLPLFYDSIMINK